MKRHYEHDSLPVKRTTRLYRITKKQIVNVVYTSSIIHKETKQHMCLDLCKFKHSILLKPIDFQEVSLKSDHSAIRMKYNDQGTRVINGHYVIEDRFPSYRTLIERRKEIESCLPQELCFTEPRVANISIACKCNFKINPFMLSNSAKYDTSITKVHYNPDEFQGIVLSFQKAQTCVIFKKGDFIIVGCKRKDVLFRLLNKIYMLMLISRKCKRRYHNLQERKLKKLYSRTSLRRLCLHEETKQEYSNRQDLVFTLW